MTCPAPRHEPGYLVAGGKRCPLPGILFEVDRLLGRRLCLRFIYAYGGGQVRIPRPMRPTHKLARLLGLDAAFVLSAHLGRERSEQIRIPNAVVELTWYWARVYYLRGHALPVIRLLMLHRHRIWVTERRIGRLVCDLAGRPRPAPPPVRLPGHPCVPARVPARDRRQLEIAFPPR